MRTLTRKEKKPKERKEKTPRSPALWKQSIGDFFRNRLVLGCISIAVALLISFVAVPVVQNLVSERVPVLRVSQPVTKGTRITTEMLTTSTVSRMDLPADAYRESGELVGRYATVDLITGDVPTLRKTTDTLPLENAYLYTLPEGKQAISVNVAGLAEGLSGKLKPGDVVTLYAAFHTSHAQEDYLALQPPELRYVKVLAVSNSSGGDIDVDDRSLTDADARTVLPATLTLQAGEMQAAALAGLDRNATLYAALVARSDNAGLVEECMEVQDAYIRSLEPEEEEADPEEDTDSGEEMEVEIPDADPEAPEEEEGEE